MSGLTLLRSDSYVRELRRQMVRYAALRLRDPALAEDVVQATLVAALEGAATFSGTSSLKTWVLAILKDKITDCMRQRKRQLRITHPAGNAPVDEALSPFVDDEGAPHTDALTATWGNPEAALRQKQFQEILEGCLEKLPDLQRKAFLLREFAELESTEISDTLGISANNLHVVLHRARRQLSACLENRCPLQCEPCPAERTQQSFRGRS